MFTKDSRTETFLTQMGVAYTYSNNVAFSDLANGWDTNNLARPVPIREAAVLEYASLMETGSPAPSPILHQRDTDYDVLDGVQRLAAERLAGFSKFSAYIVTCDATSLVTAIRVLANARLQGHPEPPEWTRRRAVEVLVIDRGMNPKEVAMMGGWKESDITRLAKVLTWGFRIRCVGGPQLPDNLVETISRYTTLDEVAKTPKPITEFFDVLKRARFSNGEAEPYVEEFFKPISKASRRHDVYTERLHGIMEQTEVTVRLHGRHAGPIPKHIVLLRTLKAAETVSSDIMNDRDDLPYIDEFFRVISKIEKNLHSMAKGRPEQKVSATPADMWSTDAQD